MALLLSVLLIGVTLDARGAADCASSGCTGVLGTAPGYGPSVPDPVANAAMVGTRIWVPALDEGYDPQGLAVVGGDLLVSGYVSDRFGRNRGQCRVFRIDPASGLTTGQFDVPAPCGHAGGLARSGHAIYVSDTNTLFETPLAGAFGRDAPKIRSIPLGPGLTGALAASGPDDIWIGTYVKGSPGRIFRFPVSSIERLKEGEALTTAMATRDLAIPSEAQGAAVDPGGRLLWVSASDYDWGTLDAIDITTGSPVAHYRVPAGVEGIDIDRAGRLWAVSEAGARHNYDMPFASLVSPFYPLAFSLDLTRLSATKPD